MKQPWWKTLLTVHGCLFLFFIYAPILIVVVYSFNSHPINMMVWKDFTFDWYFSTIVGTATALAIYRYHFRLKPFYQGLLYMPMVMPDIVLGIALLVFFVNFSVSLGLMSIIIGHCTFLISYVFVVVSARLAGMDDSLEQASADLGASPWTTFRRITLPLILPGIIGGALLAFIISMDDLVITYFIAGVDSTTLPVFIYGMLRRGLKPEINAIATLMLVFSFVIASLGLYFRKRS